MERLCVLIYEKAENLKKMIREVLVAYAVAQDTEVEIKWLQAPVIPQAVVEACAEVQVAFVNADDRDTATLIGGLIHRTVGDCALIYYGTKVPENAEQSVAYFTSLFPARPIAYLSCPQRSAFEQILRQKTEAGLWEKRFCWENKGMKYRVPQESIVYFRSDRNHVYVHLTNGKEYPFMGKLSNVEQRLPEGNFVRVHQSYLVNAKQIDMVDKGNKTVILNNGEQIYISKAHYKEALGV